MSTKKTGLRLPTSLADYCAIIGIAALLLGTWLAFGIGAELMLYGVILLVCAWALS